MKFTPPPRFYHFINDRFPVLFWSVFITVLVVASIQVKDRLLLQNVRAPQGIGSLQMGGAFAKDSAIVASWKQDTLDHDNGNVCQQKPLRIDRLKIARSDVYRDYLFILLYTALACIVIATLQTRLSKEGSWFSALLLGLALLAGLSDSIENLGLLHFITPHPTPGTIINAAVTRTASQIKYGILGLLLLWLVFTLIFQHQGLVRLSGYIREKALQLFRYRVILVSVLVFVIPMWVLDQGQDLLVNSNSSDKGVLLFMGIVWIAACLNWYLAKLFFENHYVGPVCPMTEPVLTDAASQIAEKKVSRFLGVCTILIPAVAILNAMQVIHIHSPMDVFPPMGWLLGLLGLFFVLIKKDVAGSGYLWIEKKWGRQKSKALVISLLLLLGLLAPGAIRLFLLRGESYTPDSLVYLFGHMVLLAFTFFVFVSVRSFLFGASSWMGRKIGWPVLLSACTVAILFILLNIFPLSILFLDCNYLSLPVLLSGIIFYILLFTLLIRISLWTKINFVLLIVVIALLISISANNDYHAVRQTNITSTPTPVALDQYFKQWLLQRREEIEKAPDSFPVFLVNTYGGGIRAAAFTNMVFSYLDSSLIAGRADHKGFEHFVFSVSGVSGGTIGAALQCAYRAKYLDSSSNAYSLDSFFRFYQHDFLTPVLSNALGGDVWASVSSFHLWKDRSEIQENLWEGFGRQDLHLQLDREFNALWDTSQYNRARYEVPLLFSNTLNIDDGLKGICAPVALDPIDFPATIFIRSRIDALNVQKKKDKDSLQSLSLMTGAFLSARFPYLSPSGKMGAGYHFMDGGVKDNSGAATSEAIFTCLARLVCRARSIPGDSVFSRLVRKVRFHFVSITNSPYYNPDTRQLVSNRFEPISPLIGILNSGVYGNARAADNALQYRYSPGSTPFQGIGSGYCAVWITGTCIPDSSGTLYSPVLPLGWQISGPSLQRLRRSFDPDMLGSFNAIGIPKILGIGGR
ncbi:MAG TPA: hypothetical protein VL832_15255 [Puia sp.]|nr:hypothetical protein [Puia sp.]